MSDIIIVNFKRPILSYNFRPPGRPSLQLLFTPYSSTHVDFNGRQFRFRRTFDKWRAII